MGEQMVAVIIEGKGGKDYRLVEESDLRAFEEAGAIEVERPSEVIRPEVTLSDWHVANRGDITVHLYGMKTWGSLFNPRQLVVMQTFAGCLQEALEAVKKEIADEEYRSAVSTYLGLWVSRNAMRMTTVGRWDVGGEKFQTPFDGARLPMKWDYRASASTSVTEKS
jgi:putative DNA methylase